MNSADSDSLPVDAAKARELFDLYMSDENFAATIDALGSMYSPHKDGDDV